MDAIRNRIKSAVNSLEELCYSGRVTVTDIQIRPGDYHFSEIFSKDKEADGWCPFGSDETWGGRDRHYWFTAAVTCREVWEDKEVRVTLNTGASDIWNTDNPQIMVYRNGVLSGTMDMNHQGLILSGSGKAGEVFELSFYAYSNSETAANFFHLTAAAYEKNTAALYYDLKVPFEAADLLPADDLERIEAFRVLNDCIGLLDFRKPGSQWFHQSVKEAAAYIKKHYYDIRTGSPVTVHSIGHTHIDVAWKWPLKQTKQKAVRSFQTVLNLMNRYPEFRFMSSQPQLYEFVRQESPLLFDRIREKVAQGRWEAEGAMWLEPDCNLVSGESLIRHILYGRRFFEQELGAAANEVLWLPDVFGYSAALPQIMKKSGLSYFMTTKLGWNEYNKFPYDTFWWRGIDGSEVLTYLITTRDYIPESEAGKPTSNSTTYNGLQNASQIMGTWQRYQNKDVSREVLTCYGHGDGGGGPTEEMLEQSRRLEYGVARCPQARQTFVRDFFHRLDETSDRRRLPVWNGELYLECHRGTYTSMAKNKWYNRKCEFLTGDAEFYSVFAAAAGADIPYPADELEKNWKLLLLNQFHDILPGSSIQEVYEDSAVQYEEILRSDHKMIDQARSAALAALGLTEPESNAAPDVTMDERSVPAAAGLVVFNPLSFHRTSVITVADSRLPAISPDLLYQKASDGSMIFLADDVPAKGLRLYGTGQTKSAGEPVIRYIDLDEKEQPVSIETPFYHISFNETGEMIRIFDCREQRELLKKGTCANQLLVYEDRPLEYDAWNIDATYEERFWKFEDVKEFRLLENGPIRGVLSIKREFMDTVLEQQICFYGHTARIDFKTTADWQEHQMLLKAVFPLDIQCDTADYEIQFGNVSRPTHKNTTWDQARFEVCGHKWADLSEYGYGAALLNDCKYGYDIHASVMRLTLIKSGIFPNPQADQGQHQFTYALYPHKGDFRQGNVIREAYDLNCPLEGEYLCKTPADTVGMSCSFLEIREPNVIADTVKLAEDGHGIIIRFYEAYGMRTTTHVVFPMTDINSAEECDCMETIDSLGDDPKQPLTQNASSIEFEMKPYEIKTIRLQYS
ncbi:MAG: alpha-mannosidase [Lachnospiraceae bacterium]